MSGWPDPLKPGMPLNPEKDGWHWLADPASTQFYFWHRPVKWIGEIESWLFGSCVTWRKMNESGWTYLGPCLKPAEADALRDENARLREALVKAEPNEDEIRAFMAGFDWRGYAPLHSARALREWLDARAKARSEVKP